MQRLSWPVTACRSLHVGRHSFSFGFSTFENTSSTTDERFSGQPWAVDHSNYRPINFEENGRLELLGFRVPVSFIIKHCFESDRRPLTADERYGAWLRKWVHLLSVVAYSHPPRISLVRWSYSIIENHRSVSLWYVLLSYTNIYFPNLSREREWMFDRTWRICPFMISLFPIYIRYSRCDWSLLFSEVIIEKMGKRLIAAQNNN